MRNLRNVLLIFDPQKAKILEEGLRVKHDICKIVEYCEIWIANLENHANIM